MIWIWHGYGYFLGDPKGREARRRNRKQEEENGQKEQERERERMGIPMDRSTDYWLACFGLRGLAGFNLAPLYSSAFLKFSNFLLDCLERGS